jgi:hypothetical protein
VIFAGGILANLLLGEPVLAPLKANNQLLLSTVVWYSSFYLLSLMINIHKGIVQREIGLVLNAVPGQKNMAILTANYAIFYGLYAITYLLQNAFPIS